MKILSLELKGANRLALSGISKITVTPESSIMAIIGSNGSGKSSLLYYLSPLVPERSDFDRDGYKKIRLSHHGKTYCLTSDVGGNKHSFVDEGTEEELNIGGTATMQKNLIRDYFNYNEKIHQLLTGKERFTQMSPLKRKEWFTLLCDVDYSYAIKVFNLAKDKLRDAKGALKKLTQHQMQLTSVKEDIEEIQQITNTIKHKEQRVEELNRLISYHEEYSSIGYGSELQRALQSSEKEIKESNQNLLDSINRVIENKITPEEYQINLEKQEKTKNDLAALDLHYHHLITEYTDLENQLMKINQDSQIDKDKLLIEVNQFKERLNQLINSVMSLPYSLDNPTEKLNQYDENSGMILSTLEALVYGFGDQDITQASLKQQSDTIEYLKLEYSKVNTEFVRIEEKIKFMRDQESKKKAQCPNCHHEFHPGFNPDVFQTYLNKEKELLETRDKIIIQIKEAEEAYQSDYQKYQLIINLIEISHRFAEIMNHFVRDTIKQKKYLHNAANVLIQWQQYIQALRNQVEINQLENSIREIESILDQIKNTDTKQQETLTNQLSQLNKKIEDLKLKQESLNIILMTLKLKNDHFQQFEYHQESLSKSLGGYRDVAKQIIDYEAYQMVSELIMKERNDIATLSKQQIAYLTREKNIEMVDKQISDLKKEIDAYDAIIETLNPQNGLIAEGLLGYIKLFLSRINGFIASIWTYPLIIHPAKITEDGDDELSYRFPLTVGLSDKVKSDIALGSDGILEIIDLAFKMVAMKALGLQGYPVFLDEFGRTFDAKHRENAVKLIEKLSEEFIEDQIFMVSHSFMEYSVINDVSFCVLSEDNIVLPSRNLNRGIEIERI